MSAFVTETPVFEKETAFLLRALSLGHEVAAAARSLNLDPQAARTLVRSLEHEGILVTAHQVVVNRAALLRLAGVIITSEAGLETLNPSQAHAFERPPAQAVAVRSSKVHGLELPPAPNAQLVVNRDHT